MCYPVKCQKCGKTTWAGCGLHAAAVMAKVPEDQRCTCSREGEKSCCPKVKTVEGKSELIKDIESLEQLEKAIKGGNLTVVDYYATWCVPCKQMGPIVEKMAKEFSNVKFYRCDGEKCEDVYDSQDIAGFPSFYFYKNGETLEKVSGTLTEEKFREKIKEKL